MTNLSLPHLDRFAIVFLKLVFDGCFLESVESVENVAKKNSSIYPISIFGNYLYFKVYTFFQLCPLDKSARAPMCLRVRVCAPTHARTRARAYGRSRVRVCAPTCARMCVRALLFFFIKIVGFCRGFELVVCE